MAKKSKVVHATSKKAARESEKHESRGIRFLQTELPLTTLQDAARIASALIDNYGGNPTLPPDVAVALGISPTSSGWRNLCGSSIAYGLTDGGWNAEVITLQPLGRKLVAPEAEGEDIAARREAILRPRVARDFFERY